MRHYDVAIVGCGPAGAIAALESAKAGMKTILFEAEERPAVKACAEAIPQEALRDIPMSVPSSVFLNRVDGAFLFPPSEQSPLRCAGRGWVVDKQALLEVISQECQSAGATVEFGTRVTDAVKRHGGIEIVTSGRHNGTMQAIFAIAADGANSVIARKYFRLQRQELATAVEYILEGGQLLREGWLEIYVGQAKAPSGYAWVFPRGENFNVGIGVKTADARRYLDRFLSDRPMRFGRSRRTKFSGATVPIGGQVQPITDGRAFLCGDAAGHVLPLTGAGIHTSIIAGRAAAQTASEAIQLSEPEKYASKEYPKKTLDLFGKRLQNSLRALRVFWKLSDDDLDLLARLLRGKDIVDLAIGADPRRLIAIMAKHPLTASKILLKLMG